MTNLINEALADAKLVKQAALKNAKTILEEQFEPAIKRILSQQLSEEEEDDMYESSYENDGEEGIPAELGESEDMGMEDEDDMELESILRELEGEEEEDPMAAEVPVEPVAPAPVAPPTAPVAPVEPAPVDPLAGDYGSEDGLDDELEEILREIEEEELEESNVRNFDNAARNEARQLRKENKELKAKLKEAMNGISTLRKNMNEISLLNHKLVYSTNLNRKFKLSENQQTKVLTAFDNSNTIREAKLVYATLAEHFKETTEKAQLKESASKTIKTTTNIIPNRMQKLAGIV